MKKIIFCLIFISLFVSQTAYAKDGNMKLLAVRQYGENMTGSIANLYLEIQPGNGRVFVDTFPLSKLDTQVSTRFAKEIACNYLDINCDKYDFYYTIRANSPIIAGPSAGAAITVLTISLLGDIDISEDVALTGTINSGGLIGPVGGIKEKIEAAGQSGIKKVLIPFGERFITSDLSDMENISGLNEDNITAKETSKNKSKFDLVKYGEDIGVTVKEVSDLDDVIYEFTGKKREAKSAEINIDESYMQIMKQLAIGICKRNDDMKKMLDGMQIPEDENYSILYNDGLNLSEKGKKSMDEKRFYSSASYCFGSNVKLGSLILLIRNESNKEILDRIKNTKKELDNFRIPDYRTIADLQAYMIVEERIENSKDYLDLSRKRVAEGKKEDALFNLAYAIERKFSAYSWSIFITGKGRSFKLSQEDLKNSCEKKLSEAEERYQYVNLFYPSYLRKIREDIDEAYSDFNDSNYERCLFKASKAKAEIDVILSIIGVEKDNLDDLLERKLDIVEKTIMKQTEKGLFPILGFSYFEYANDLKETDRFSSLLYSEYALELGNLDIYFPEKRDKIFTDKDLNEIGIFLIGLGTGLLLGVVFFLFARRKILK